MTGFCEHSNEP